MFRSTCDRCELQLILRSAAQMSSDLIIVGRRGQPDPLGGGDFGSIARTLHSLRRWMS